MNRHLYLRAGACIAIVLGLFLLPGCPPDDEPAGGNGGEQPKTPAEAPAAPTVAAAGDAVLVEIDEHNTDTFPGSLGIVDDETPADGFLVHDGQVVLGDGELANAPGVPLAECRLLVVHRIHYAGAGRTGVDTRRYAFAKPPGVIALPAAPLGDAWPHTPDDTGLFSLAVRDIRPMPGDASDIKLALDGEAVTVTVGDQARTVQPDASADWPAASRTLTVRERGLTADDVVFENAPPGPAPRIESSDVDHGQVTFTTKLTITNRGRVPVFDRDPAPPEDL